MFVNPVSMRLGLDLDNTIIRYDRAFAVAARTRGLIPEGFSGGKAQICERVRSLPDGERQWQALQGYVYGTGINEAELFEGVKAFLARAKAQGAQICIVSHKTQFGHFDPMRVDLREAAKAFLTTHGILDYVTESQVFFHTRRAEKIAQIKALGCQVFVDDLEEVFTDPTFPIGVRKLLFTQSPPDNTHGMEPCASWAEIEQTIFDAAGQKRPLRH